jgi:hypothetical protein
MSEALEKLKSLGAQKIYEETHIPIGHVQAVLHESYDGLTRIQFLGFLSILEREYNIDLRELRERASQHYDEQESTHSLADDGIFIVPSKARNFTPLYIVIVIGIFLVALYYTLGVAEKTNETKKMFQTQQEQSEAMPEKPLEIINDEMNLTEISNDVNSSATVSKSVAQEHNRVKEKPLEQMVPSQPLEILPRSRVWLGYIDVATNKKYQKTFSDALDLDADKEWLLLFGHGYVDLIVNGEKIHFSEKNNLRLHYKDGMLEKISLAEFKKINRGRKW